MNKKELLESFKQKKEITITDVIQTNNRMMDKCSTSTITIKVLGKSKIYRPKFTVKQINQAWANINKNAKEL